MVAVVACAPVVSVYVVELVIDYGGLVEFAGMLAVVAVGPCIVLSLPVVAVCQLSCGAFVSGFAGFCFGALL